MKINRPQHGRDKELKGDILKDICYCFRLFIALIIVKEAKLHRLPLGSFIFLLHVKVNHFTTVTTALQYDPSVIVYCH